ncbi:MAG: peptidyl-prolyl cis-trans isomerase, partial [Xanthomonadales bacterium]|nr:peptidyl-prolyl cis-trans isomerase [Xanthomonadales bacterium]
PGQFRTEEQRRELLDAIITEERLLQAALEQGMDEDPEVRRAYRRMLANRLRDQLLDERLEAVEVTDEEVRSYYEANAQRYERPERRRAAIIFASRQRDKNETLGRLETVRKKAAELDDITHFGHLALENSEDQASRYVGGAIGWLSTEQPDRYKWGPKVVNALFELPEVGAVSDIIETDDGFYLVRLMAVDSGGDRDYSKLEAGIRRALLTEKQREARQQLLDDFSGGAKVEINDLALTRAEPPDAARVAENNRPPALPDKG